MGLSHSWVRIIVSYHPLPRCCAGLALLGAIGCGSSSAAPEEPTGPVIARVVVGPSDQPLVSVGQNLQLQATVTSVGGTQVVGAAIAWTTSDPNVLTVTSTGLMAGVGDGTATVTATVEGQAGTVGFRVVDLTGTWTGGENPDTVSYSLTQSGTSVSGAFQSVLGFPPITDVNTGTLTGSLEFEVYSHVLALITESGCALRITGTHRVEVQGAGELVLAPGPTGTLSSTNCSIGGTIDFATLRRQ